MTSIAAQQEWFKKMRTPLRDSGGFKRKLRYLLSALAVVAVAACGNATREYDYPTDPKKDYLKEEGFFGGTGGISLFDGDADRRAQEEGEAGGGIGVNAFLWRATLDTISFMPITSADAFGGVIITDWHSTPESPAERFKMNVYILGRALRADGVKVSVFRQVQDAAGWRDATLPTETSTKIEDAILTKARQLRSDSGGQ